jgi:hypothetical protein
VRPGSGSTQRAHGTGRRAGEPHPRHSRRPSDAPIFRQRYGCPTRALCAHAPRGSAFLDTAGARSPLEINSSAVLYNCKSNRFRVFFSSVCTRRPLLTDSFFVSPPLGSVVGQQPPTHWSRVLCGLQVPPCPHTLLIAARTLRSHADPAHTLCPAARGSAPPARRFERPPCPAPYASPGCPAEMVSSNMWNWVTGPDGAMVCVPNHGRQQEWSEVCLPLA